VNEKVEIIADLKDLISGKFADINKQIDAMDSKLSKVGSKGGGGIMGQVLGANVLTSAISKVSDAFVQFGKDSFDAYGRAEQFQVALKTLLYGNEQQAKALNNQLKSFALETPFELTEIQAGTRMMIAYGSSAGNVVNEMRMLGDIGSGVGSTLSEIAYLYGTLRTQGRAYTKDINQFTGRGIPIIKELAKQFKVADKAIMQMVEDGKIGFKEVEKAFQSMTAEGGQFHNMMAEQSKTLLGQTSNLADAWDQLKAAIGESQSGILKGTISWATQMVAGIKSVIDRGNYQHEAQKDQKDEFKVVKRGFWENMLSFPGLPMDFSTYKKDNRYVAVNNTVTGIDKGDKRTFESKEMLENFLQYSKEGKNYDYAGEIRTDERFDQFTTNWMAKLSKITADVGKSKTPQTDIAKAMRDVLTARQDILSQIKEDKISNPLAVSELDVLTQVGKDIAGLKALEESKTDGKEPAKLDEVAKKNKAVQIIVNIENLVRELTNVNQSASANNQQTTDGVLKALLAAVNDIYAVGQ
jgi:tape measure domain-containing protein